jgi:hypothetical protein
VPGHKPRQGSVPRTVPAQQSLFIKSYPQSFVAFALALVADNPYPAHLSGVGDVSATVCLQVEANYLNCTHFLDLRWEKVDLGSDEVGYLERLFTGQHANSNLSFSLYERVICTERSGRSRWPWSGRFGTMTSA